jgi:hypothetical protein
MTRHYKTRDYLLNERQKIKCIGEIIYTQFRVGSKVQDSLFKMKPIQSIVYVTERTRRWYMGMRLTVQVLLSAPKL